MRALVVGGTGPTGPLIVEGLRERGYEVVVLHRGTHEVPMPADVEHIHTDPHFRETLDAALAGREFDLAIATYGRIRHVAEALIGKTPRLITVGGTVGYRGVMVPETNFPGGVLVPVPETAPRVATEDEFRFGYLIAMTEDVVMRGHTDGHYAATHFRYPVVYGPSQLAGPVWAVMRRILDGREHIVLPDGGLTLVTRGYVDNLAHTIMLAVDQETIAAGKIYNCGDAEQLTMRQWVDAIAKTMGHDWSVWSVPDAVSHSSRDFVPFKGASHHQLMDLGKVVHELGYQDVVKPLDAIARTVEWYLENPPAKEATPRLDRGYPYNYEAEDRLVEIMAKATAEMAAVPFEEEPVSHPYPHPKQPGLDRDHKKR